MVRGSTPVNEFDVDIDLTGATVYITYAQNGRTLFEKVGNDVTITPTKLSCKLTQEETLLFDEKVDAEMQIAYVFSDGTADRSNVIRESVDRILHEGVIEP